ncbi:tRNA(Ile)-lysidine synthetase, partial [Micromonospora phytophila]|nr:tRNA(Ile)-lysidine synthetase [Micromonospora phytophila]
MAALAPPVAAIRVSVRRALADLPPEGPVLVACSGGADSLALAAAVAFVAPRLGRPA